MVSVTAEALNDSPCPRMGVTIAGLGIGASIVTVWRILDGERQPVPGIRRVVMNDANYITDYYAPLGRPLTYEAEVLSGPAGPVRAQSAPVTLYSDTAWLMDPLIPQTAIPVTDGEDDGVVYLRAKALSALEHAADVSLIQIMGQDSPMGLFGPRMKPKGVDISMATTSAAQNRRLKRLIESTAQLLYRPLPSMSQVELPGAWFVSLSSVAELPVNMGWDGFLTNWELKADTVGAPSIKVLTATFTYGDVQILTKTYQQKQDRMAGKSYLEDLKNPIA